VSDLVILGIIAVVPTTLAALGALLVSLRNGKKSDIIIEKAAEIHTLTNSNLSKLTSQLEVANSKITGLERLVASLVEAKGIADRLASKPPTL
jgi:hypothetical protein